MMRYLGIDFGLRRIGLAVSEGNLATPLKMIQVKNLSDGIHKVIEVAKVVGAEKIIVGLPEGKIGNTALGFINGLKKSGLNVESTDETLSTQGAQKIMINLGIRRKERQINDAYSAAIILQNWLDSQ